MRWYSLGVAIALVSAGCGSTTDCAQSADIQVTVAPNDDVTIAEVARLHVMLSVADGPIHTLDIGSVAQPVSLKPGSAFILHPDNAPPDKYDVSMTVQAFDGADDLIAIGSESMQAVSKGCNRLTVHLAALPLNMSVDMAIPPGGPIDMAGVAPPDLAGCIGGTPDEDSDGRANSCDLCPDDADSTPVDSDGDGLPDACDPDPAAKNNRLVYFDPFDSASGHWAGTNTVQNSYMVLDTHGSQELDSGNATDALPANVRVQTHLYPVGYYSATAPIDGGLFVGTSTNLGGATTNGAYCYISTTDKKLELYPVQGGALGQAALATIGTVMSTVYRLRLTNSNGVWTCEMLVGNNVPVTVTTTQAVTAPLFVTLIVDNGVVNYHSVVAESKL